MSKLLKSKFLLGVLAVVFVLAATQVALAADGAITMTLKKGMKNVQVKYLQQTLNEKGYTVATTGAGSVGSETTYFGPATTTAVKKFQAAMGLVADGVFGAKSRAALGGSVVTTYPAGCTSAVGFSPTTGLPCNGTTTVPTTGPVAVMVATDNPASGTLVAGQATADLAHFTFTGSGTVTALTLQRIGVSADSTPSNIYLFDGATRLTDAASVTSTGLVTFTNPAGLFMGGKTISVKSDIASNTSGQTLGMKLVSYTVGGVVTTANLSGNVHNIASATLASVSAGTVTPSGATINPASGVTLWQSTLTVSQRDVLMKRLALRQVGSAPAASFQNFKLYVNGVQVATSTGLDINGYVTFDMSSAPVTLVAGSRVVRVDADVVSGASRTVQLSVRQAADVDFVDSSFGVNITPTGFAWTGSASTISGSSGGSLTVEKDVTSPSTNLTLSGNDVNLGTFKLTAYGESIKVETLKAGFTYTDASAGGNTATLRNGRLLINGVQYGSTATLLAAGTSFTVNYTVVPGTPVLVEVHADVYDNDGTDAIAASDSILAKLVTGSSNATRVDSLGSFNVPSADVSANTLTVATTSIAALKNGTYANQTTVVPATNFKIGAWNLTGSSVEDVLLTTLSFDVDSVTNATFSADDITNMYVVVKNGSTIVAQPSPLGTVAAADNNYSINYTLPKNGSVTIELYGNFGSTVTSGDSFKTDLSVSGTSLVSGQTVSSNDKDGQTIAYGAASITATKDASSPVASIVYDNQTVTAAAYKFAAVTSGYNVTDLVFTLATSTVASMLELYDGSTLVASQSGADTITFSGLAWNVPANTNKVLTAKLVLGGVGIGAGTTGSSQVLTLTGFTAVNTSTGVSAAGTESNPAGSDMYAYAATPTITQLALPTTLLGTGTQTVAKFTVDSNGGTIGWKKFIFTVTRAMGGVDTLATPTLWDGSTQVAGTAAFTGSVEADGGTSGTITFVATDEQQISGSKTYTLKLVTAATLADGDNLNVSIANPSSYAASAAYATVAATTSSFSWTDTSASSHSATTSDWSNDYLVKNLPTDTWTLIK
ncbi:MAG: peptidoglycan-binding protein [Burkholderiales bacterium]|nr:peptidoglycan-binding protein [Burkholderiales bacterium]